MFYRQLLKSTPKWIFVGGKGGVGKTTCSSTLAVLLAQKKLEKGEGEKVLLVSTDPAHSTSDAFGQKFGDKPTPVTGSQNLFVMEVKPQNKNVLSDKQTVISKSLGNVVDNAPGIDEAMSFSLLLNEVDKLAFSTVIFDTAPTGHTLRLLQLPKVMSSFLGSLGPLSGLLSTVFNVLADNDKPIEEEGKQQQGEKEKEKEGQKEEKKGEDKKDPNKESIFSNVDPFQKIERLKVSNQAVLQKMKDPNHTTFVCVCIPECLSLYENERLIQQIVEQEIDISTIIVNQIVVPPCLQNIHFILQLFLLHLIHQQMFQKPRIVDYAHREDKQLYEEGFDDEEEKDKEQEDETGGIILTKIPLLNSEIRGIKALSAFSQLIITPHNLIDSPPDLSSLISKDDDDRYEIEAKEYEIVKNAKQEAKKEEENQEEQQQLEVTEIDVKMDDNEKEEKKIGEEDKQKQKDRDQLKEINELEEKDQDEDSKNIEQKNEDKNEQYEQTETNKQKK